MPSSRNAPLELESKRALVMGLGRFGGGVGVTRWLCERGAEVLVTDLDPADKLTESLAAIQPLIDRGQVSLRLGEHNVSDFTTRDLVVANVAVPKPWDNRFLRAAEAAGVPITTEITLLLSHLPDSARLRTVAITGSAGKSTTSAMIHHALSACAPPARRALLGGNIGGSLLPELPAIDDRTFLVLELSSAMLYWISRDPPPSAATRWSPRVAVVTNIAPNHLDWHGDEGHYAAAKQHLIRHQVPGDTAVLGESVWSWRDLTRAGALPIDPATISCPMALPGAHNRLNAAAALAACRAIAPEVPASDFERSIAGFTGLTHRLQLVAEIKPRTPDAGGSLRFFNDSKSTTPDSCLRAIEALEATPGLSADRIHLIAGGYDKGSDLTPIARAAARLAGLYTIGATGPTLAAAAGERAAQCGTLERAFTAAVQRMRPGDVLVLSPGCASWDQFVNFEQRGEAFIRLVKELVR